MLTTHAGIGDILIAKMICRENNIRERVQYDKSLVKLYREDSESYYNFLDKLNSTLFDEENVENNIKNNINFCSLINTIKNYSLSEYFDLKPVYDFDYIVFQTKGRFLFPPLLLPETIKSLLVEKFSKLNSKYKIILLGERERQTNNSNDSIYENIYPLLQNLKKNNEVIDMTLDKRLHVNPDWDNFLRDISIIHYSKLNINIGLGGNFVMSTSFSENTISYTSNDRHAYMDILKPNICFSDINEYFKFMENVIL